MRKKVFWLLCSKMLEATFELIVPLVVARIMDIGIKNQDNVYIWHQCVIMVLLGVIGLACSLIAQYFFCKGSHGIQHCPSQGAFSHISRLSYRELDMLGTPTLVTRITNDVNQAQTGVNMVLRLFLRSPFIVVGAVIMSFTIDVKIGLIFLIAVPVISIVIYGIMRTTVPIYKKAQSFLDRISPITRENHVGARVVRAFGRQQEEYKEFSEVNDDYTKVQVRAGKNFRTSESCYYGYHELLPLSESSGMEAGKCLWVFLHRGSGCPCKLYEPDPDRTDRSCKPDRGSDKGYGFRCASE